MSGVHGTTRKLSKQTLLGGDAAPVHTVHQPVRRENPDSAPVRSWLLRTPDSPHTNLHTLVTSLASSEISSDRSIYTGNVTQTPPPPRSHHRIVAVSLGPHTLGPGHSTQPSCLREVGIVELPPPGDYRRLQETGTICINSRRALITL